MQIIGVLATRWGGAEVHKRQKCSRDHSEPSAALAALAANGVSAPCRLCVLPECWRLALFPEQLSSGALWRVVLMGHRHQRIKEFLYRWGKLFVLGSRGEYECVVL